MRLFNTSTGYGGPARALHWLMALAIAAMFALGLWMRSLSYYSPYYKSAPDLHKSIGLVLLVLLVVRFAWKLINQSPDAGHLSRLEQNLAQILHWAFYPLLLALMISGYLISTVDGRPIEVFGLVEIPSVIESKGLEDIAGEIHEWLAWITIGLAGLHGLAAIKHHLIDRGQTLLRMLGRSQSLPGTQDNQPAE